MDEESEMSAIWREHWTETLERVQVIRELAERAAESADPADLATRKPQARFQAHTLAGSSALFGRREASRIALRIEALLDDREILTAQDGGALMCLVAALREALDAKR